MPILTDNDLIDLMNNRYYTYIESGKTGLYNGILNNFDGLDINEYLKNDKNQCNSSLAAITKEEIVALF